MNRKYAIAIAIAAVVVVVLIVVIPQLGGDDSTASTPLDQTGQAPPISEDATMPADHPDISGSGATAEPGGEEAVAAAEAAYEANPDDPQVVLDLADAYLSAGRTDDAVAVMQEALTAQPEDASLRAAMAMIDLNRGNAAEAEKALTALVAEDPTNQEAAYDLAIVFWSTNQPDKARETWQKVVDLDPESEFGTMAAQFVTMLDAPGGGQSPHGSGGAMGATTTTTG